MAPCIVTPMPPVTEELVPKSIDALSPPTVAALQSAFAEGFIQAHVMGTAGQESKVHEMSLLQHEGVQMGLHDNQEMVRQPVVETCDNAYGEEHQKAVVDSQELAEVLAELTFTNEYSILHTTQTESPDFSQTSGGGNAGLSEDICAVAEPVGIICETEPTVLLDEPKEVDLAAEHYNVSTAIDADVKEREAAVVNVANKAESATAVTRSFSFPGLNHVAFCVANLEQSLQFYSKLLGLKTNLDRPDLPYRGAWLDLGAEGIHLMEVPNPDPVHGRPAHGGWDRHACLNCHNVEGLRLVLQEAGIPYQPSPVPSIFTRDPDGNGLEFIEASP